VFELEEELKKIKEKIEREKEEKKQKEKEEKISELKERYKVVKGIPEQIVEGEKVEIKPEGKEEFPEITLKVERLDAKIATIDDYRKVTDEKISRISEEIGELRSTFLALDKRFSPLEMNAERALKAVSEVMPEKIRADFQKIEREILGIRAEIERMNAIIDSVRSEEKKLMEAFEKIKNVENVLDISKKIEEKIARVEEASRYADRVSAKTEVVFSELSGKLAEIERQKGKISRLDELTKELVKTLDEISLKIPKFAEKVEVSKLGEEILSRIKSIEPESIKMEVSREINSKVGTLKEEVMNSLREIENVKKSLEEIPKKVESLSLELAQSKNEIEELKKSMIKEIPIEEMRAEYEKKIEEIKASLEQESASLRAEYEKKIEEIKRIPEILSRVESLIEENSTALKDFEEKNEKKFSKISKLIEELTKIVEAESVRSESLQQALNDYLKILAKVNGLQTLTKKEDIEASLANIGEDLRKMKEAGISNKEIENFLASTLINLSKIWAAYNKEIAELYRTEANKYSEIYSLEAEEKLT
jgi:chromosome segregation ATPase